MFQHLRWVHPECASSVELPEEKCICLLCKDTQQQPVTQTYTAKTQTREASEETEGHTDLVEMTIQTDADEVTIEQTDLSEVTVGQQGTAEEALVAQAEVMADKETPMELGKSRSCTAQDKPCKSCRL